MHTLLSFIRKIKLALNISGESDQDIEKPGLNHQQFLEQK